ncbi:MAG: VWA domain-containing protein [Anaerolineales bacterium]
MTEPSGYFLHNLLYFGRVLRALGLDVQPDGVSNLVKATQWFPLDHKQDFYHSARALLVRRQQDLAAFDRVFDQFWQASSGWRLEIGPEAPDMHSESSEPISITEPETPVSESPVGATRYSPEEVLREKDFAELDADELAAIKPLLLELAWKLGQRRSRRWGHGSGPDIDVRRMLRQSMRYEGESLRVLRRKLRRKPRRLVVLADISGSMERYSSLLMHFVFGLSESLEQWTEVFVFGTRLTRISRQLSGHNVELALGKVAQRVPDWSGGTRIGQALKTFNFFWARRVLTRGAVVLLVSDGWDRGDVDLLHVEMARLQRSSFRLIWLNPLLGSPDYEPLTRGLQAALPFVDDFLPVHNLASVEDLAIRLETLKERRPARKQQSSSFRQGWPAAI